MADPNASSLSTRRRRPRQPGRSAPRRRPRSLFRRPVRRRHSHLDARVVPRSHPCARPRLHRSRPDGPRRAPPPGGRNARGQPRLLEQGRTAAARHLLTEAVAASGDDEKVRGAPMKLDRLERLEGGPMRRQLSECPTPACPRRRGRPALAGVSIGSLLVAPAAIACSCWSWARAGSRVRLAGPALAERAGGLARRVAVAARSCRAGRSRSYGPAPCRPRPARRGAAGPRLCRPRTLARLARPSLRIDIQQLLLAGAPDASAPADRDEMSEVPLPELRAGAAIPAHCGSRFRCPSRTSRSRAGGGHRRQVPPADPPLRPGGARRRSPENTRSDPPRADRSPPSELRPQWR